MQTVPSFRVNTTRLLRGAADNLSAAPRRSLAVFTHTVNYFAKGAK